MTHCFNDLLDLRIQELGLSRQDFICRLGYQNIAKGERRFRALEAGDLRLARKRLPAIASALELPHQAIEDAISAEWAERKRLDDEAYRLAFRPHAVLRTTRTTPSPIAIAGLINAVKRLYVCFPKDLPVDQYASFVARSLPEGVPCYGRVTGFFCQRKPGLRRRV